MNEFKEKLSDLIIDYQNEEILYGNFAIIYNWPEISYYDEDNDSNDYQPLGTENCSIIDMTETYIELTCGGDLQESHLIRIELLDGELAVTSYEQHEFLEGMDYDEVIQELGS